MVMPQDREMSSASSTVASGPSASNFWVAALLTVLVGKVGDWMPGLTGVPVVKIAFLLAVLQAFRVRESRHSVRVRSLSIARSAIAFLFLSIFSVFFSVYKSNTLLASQLSIIYLLSLTLIVKTTQSPRDLNRLLMGLAAAGVSLAVGAIFNYQGGRASINDNFDPNDIAYELDSLIPVVLAVRAGRSRAWRLALGSLVALMTASVLLTGSRGGAIGLGAVIVLVAAFPVDMESDGSLRVFCLRGFLLRALLIGLAGIAVWSFLPDTTKTRLSTLMDLSQDYSADLSLKGSRRSIWRRDMNMAFQRPIGYGMGAAEIVDGMAGGQYRTAHNSLVQVFVELGVIGILLYGYTYYVSWRELRRVSRRAGHGPPLRGSRRAPLYARGLSIALAGNLAAGFFLSQAYSAALWMLFAVSAALVRLELESDQGSGSRSRDLLQAGS